MSYPVLFLFSVLGILLLSQHAYAELTSFVAKYEIKSIALTKAEAVNQLTINNSQYSYHSLISPSGWLSRFNNSIREETSEGRIENQQLIPYKYSYKLLKSDELRRHVEIEFSNDRNKIINHHKHINNRWKMDMVEGVQDHLSYQLALMLTLQSSVESDNKRAFYFPVADGGRLKKYSFKLLGKEKLETPIGLLHTLKLEHKAYNQDDTITIWCAADLAYLPVKVIQESNHSRNYKSIIISYQSDNESKQ